MTQLPHDPAPGAGPNAAAVVEALAAARVRLERALEACPCTIAPAEDPDPAAAAQEASAAYVASAEGTGLLPDGAGDALLAPLAERLRTAETSVEALRRAERAMEWALLAARRRAWRAEAAPPAAPGAV